MIKFRDHYNFSGFNVAPPIFLRAHYIDQLVTQVQILHFVNKIFVILRLITKFIVPQNLELYGILLLIYAPTDFLTEFLILTQYKYICTASTLNTIIERFGQTWLCPYLNRCILLCFYSCVLSILRPPALHSTISRMRNRTFPCYGLTFFFLSTRLIISAGQNLLACRIL